ncbi:hypothetical protein EZS27_038617, partial [termite gut metagenome]
SNGKNVVNDWLYQLRAPGYAVVRSPRSYNSRIGVPLSVWQLNENTDLAIFEAGISQPGEMPVLQTIIQPTIGILTSIGSAHQENFSSLHEKCMEKLSLFRDCEAIIYNGTGKLPGYFKKSVTLRTNNKTEMIRLHIEGTMEAEK